MRELSLFTGAGGGVYGSILLGHRLRGYVEFDPHCQRVIARRIADGIFDRAPIFGDLREFNDQGYARSYRGMVDLVSGGFPCQPFSVAGKREGRDDARNMWPATLDTLREVRPRWCFFENVPGLVSRGYFGEILGGLAALGYAAEWGVLGARAIGCPANGERLWILAAEANQINRSARLGIQRKRDQKRPVQRKGDQGSTPIKWWSMDAPCGDGRMDNGLARRRKRLEAAGNGQVPALAATAFRLLMERFQ